MFVKFCFGLPSVILIICVAVVEAKRAILRRNFATKSRYPSYNVNEVFEPPERCKPLLINMVFRHGTRYPGKKDVDGMNNLAHHINQYVPKDATRQYGELTLPWINGFHYGDKMLARRGEEEMYNISKRLSKKLPSLFHPRYFGEKHFFVSTSTPRTSQSASAFAFGLFEGKGHLGPSKFQPVSLTTTSLSHPDLRFFDACHKYKMLVSKNKKNSLKEFYKFQDGPEIEHVKKAIAKRLNISEISNIATKHLQHMFLSCAYEAAVYGNGQWCSVFEDDELDTMEYLYDIKNYWKRGYGYEINYKISCLLLKNLTESVRNVVNSAGKSHTKAIFHFSHAETVIPLLCILGLFNDTEPLLATNYHRQEKRLFKTANMAPFSGNVAVVLYSCETDSDSLDQTSFHVQVLANEKVVGLHCCDMKELCPVQQFLTCFGHLNHWCDFSKMCNDDQKSTSEDRSEL